jgi:hypothetical protein
MRCLRIPAQRECRVCKLERNIQNKSPTAPASPLAPSWRSRIVHSHAGYSSSASATGSCLFFSKFRPLSGVPTATELFTSGVGFLSATLAAFFAMLGLGAGVSGALNGCAAEVDVAAGGACDDVALPWRGAGVEADEMGVALDSAGEEERKRRMGTLGRREARRQVRQIIVGVWTAQWGWGEMVLRLHELLESAGVHPSPLGVAEVSSSACITGIRSHHSNHCNRTF